MAAKGKLLRKCLRQQQRGTNAQSKEVPWHNKALHGMYHRQITEVTDIRKAYQWLEKVGLTDSTEALILATQEQALGTRSIEQGSTTPDRTPGVDRAKRRQRQSNT